MKTKRARKILMAMRVPRNTANELLNLCHRTVVTNGKVKRLKNLDIVYSEVWNIYTRKRSSAQPFIYGQYGEIMVACWDFTEAKTAISLNLRLVQDDLIGKRPWIPITNAIQGVKLHYVKREG